jgi:drug/metabolite transporter (DMT)-like permease
MGEVAALIAAMTWACTSVALTSLSTRTPPVVLSALRLSAATLVLPFILLASGQAGDIADESWKTILAVIGSGLVGYALGDTIYIRVLGMLGLQKTFPISMALFIGLTVVGGVVLLDEPFKWGLPAGALLIGAGVYLIVIPGRRGKPQPMPAIPVAEPALTAFAEMPEPVPPAADAYPWLAYALLLAVGILWATATLWLAGAKGHLGAVAAGSLRTPAGAVGLLAFGLMTQPRAVAAPFRDRKHLAGIIGAGLAGTAFGSLLYVYAVVEAGAARTAVLSATAPLMGLPLSIIFLNERFTRRIGVATLLCVLGILLVVA